MPSAQPGYIASTRAEFLPPPGTYAPSPVYPPAPSYNPGSNYNPQPGYPGGGRPGPNDVYNQPYDDLYDEQSPHSSYVSRGPRDVRTVDPRGDTGYMRQESIRQDPRLAVDPRYGVPDSRIDSRGVRDPRMPSQYEYTSSNPLDLPSRGGYNDEYSSMVPQPGRGAGSYAPPSRVQAGYDAREPPNVRDTYRHEPIREERRRR